MNEHAADQPEATPPAGTAGSGSPAGLQSGSESRRARAAAELLVEAAAGQPPEARSRQILAAVMAFRAAVVEFAAASRTHDEVVGSAILKFRTLRKWCEGQSAHA